MSIADAAIAANRFGLGAKPGELRRIASDPRGWLLQQLSADPPAAPAAIDDVPSTGEALLTYPLVQSESVLVRRLQRRAQSPADKAQAEAAQRAAKSRRRTQTLADHAVAEARLDAAVQSDQPFRERLVQFWSDHFTVSGAHPTMRVLPGVFERDVVRPRIGGTFSELLIAATRHPAMQVYLDNHRNVGPNAWYARHPDEYPASPFVKQLDVLDINENHAREILELHTLGVDGGYTQGDVEQLARALTGWGVAALLGDRTEQRARLRQALSSADPLATLRQAHDALGRRFAGERWQALGDFDARAHEPGEVNVLNRRYAQTGREQGEAVLRDLAVHPSTAHYLARKLCQHFIADQPPEAAVTHLARAFRESEGDLLHVSRALVHAPQAWAPQRRKFKQPFEYLVSVLRGLDAMPSARGDRRRLLGALKEMGQRPYRPPGPDGWPDEEGFWASPDGVWKRIEWVHALAQRVASADWEVAGVAEALLGDDLAEATRQGIERAPSPAEALVLLLLSPDFLRR